VRSNNEFDRRRFVKLTGVAAATVVLGAAPFGNVAQAAALTKAQREKLTSDEIIALMKQGNQRFRLGKESPHDSSLSRGRAPRASILRP
jgi:carbonic anhydrase